jgi:GntR family histidine utilization transcriptional repressor
MGSKGWEDIRAEVLRRIRAREWHPGAQIPTEEDLAAEFGVARATVNRALRELATAGVLERRRKAGTRVAALPVRKATLDIPVIRQEIEARGQA